MKGIKITRVAQLAGHSGSIYSLAVLDRQHFISAGSDKVLAMWETGGLEEGVQVAAASDVVYSLFYDTLHQRLLAGQSVGGIHVIDLQQKKETRLLQYHDSAVYAITPSYAHGLLFSGDATGTVHVSTLNDFTPVQRFSVGTGKVRAIIADDATNRLLVGSGDGSVYVVGLPDFNLQHSFKAHQEGFSVNALCLVPGTDILLSGSRDAHLHVYDIKNNFKLLQSIPAHNYAIYTIAMHPTEKIFATASRDKSVKIWDADSMEVLARIDKENFDGHTASVNKLVWTHDGHLVTGSDDRSAMVWKVEEKL
jgi:WD40 repeat protein